MKCDVCGKEFFEEEASELTTRDEEVLCEECIEVEINQAIRDLENLQIEFRKNALP